MENAVKALLIAAGVLIGLMIISLGISLYTSLSDYVESTQNDIIARETQQFNEQFTKYINYNEDTGKKEFTLTIQDIVTAANTASENNTNYNLDSATENNYYVTVKLNGEALEKIINSESAIILQNGLGNEYKCGYNDVEINLITDRVCEVNFSIYTAE